MSGALRSTSAGGQRELTSTAELEEWVVSGTVVLFKHSPACWISTMAGREVKQFSTNFPHITIGVVDVLRSRALSDDIAERYGASVTEATPDASKAYAECTKPQPCPAPAPFRGAPDAT